MLVTSQVRKRQATGNVVIFMQLFFLTALLIFVCVFFVYFFFRKVHGPRRHLVRHIVQGCRLMLVEVGAPALQATLGQMGAQTFTPSTRLSGKPGQIREKVFAACTLIAHCWTRCALKTPYTRAQLAQRQSARRTKS